MEESVKSASSQCIKYLSVEVDLKNRKPEKKKRYYKYKKKKKNFPGVLPLLLSSRPTSHNILSKPLASFPHTRDVQK